MQLKFSRKWFLGIVLILLPLLVIDSCMQFRMSSSEIKEYFSKRGLQETEHSYKIGSRVINYVHVGNESLPLVMFVHGSPGSLSAFIRLLLLLLLSFSCFTIPLYIGNS